MNKFRTGIILVPERLDIVKVVTDEMDSKNIPCDMFLDTEHNGCIWNFNQRLKYYCENNFDDHIVWSDDDLIFKDGWYEKAQEVMNETDYDVVCLFTNKNSKANDVCGIHRAGRPYFFYEVGAIFRKGVLNQKFWNKYEEYCKSSERNDREKNHPDIMLSSFLFNNGYKCGTVRPNYIALQDVPSVLGHKIVIKDN